MRKFIATIGTLVLASGAAFAGDKANDVKSFEDLDQDKNGALTKEEASADRAVAAVFAKADMNQDGYLTQTEYNRIVDEKEDAE